MATRVVTQVYSEEMFHREMRGRRVREVVIASSIIYIGNNQPARATCIMGRKGETDFVRYEYSIIELPKDMYLSGHETDREVMRLLLDGARAFRKMGYDVRLDVDAPIPPPRMSPDIVYPDSIKGSVEGVEKQLVQLFGDSFKFEGEGKPYRVTPVAAFDEATQEKWK